MNHPHSYTLSHNVYAEKNSTAYNIVLMVLEGAALLAFYAGLVSTLLIIAILMGAI